MCFQNCTLNNLSGVHGKSWINNPETPDFFGSVNGCENCLQTARKESINDTEEDL